MSDQIPWIRKGVGKSPNDGGCIMQVIDWLDCNNWTDAPVCVHPVIRSFAIQVNDSADDATRQRLLTLTSRMMNTAGGDVKLTRQLLGYLAKQVYPIFDKWKKEKGYDDKGAVYSCIEAAQQGKTAWAAGAALAAETAETAEAAWAAGATELGIPTPFDLLIGLLDEYDGLTGRSKVTEPIDYASVCQVMGQTCSAIKG